MPPSSIVRWYGWPEPTPVQTRIKQKTSQHGGLRSPSSHWKLYRYQREMNVSRTSVLSSRQPKGSSFKRCSNKIAISSLGSRTKNRLRMIGGLCMLMGPPAQPDQESDSSLKHQPTNSWNNPFVWSFPLQTMKLNMRSSYPDWTCNHLQRLKSQNPQRLPARCGTDTKRVRSQGRAHGQTLIESTKITQPDGRVGH